MASPLSTAECNSVQIPTHSTQLPYQALNFGPNMAAACHGSQSSSSSVSISIATDLTHEAREIRRLSLRPSNPRCPHSPAPTLAEKGHDSFRGGSRKKPVSSASAGSLGRCSVKTARSVAPLRLPPRASSLNSTEKGRWTTPRIRNTGTVRQASVLVGPHRVTYPAKVNSQPPRLVLCEPYCGAGNDC
jgi:hypothetical protein